MELCNFCKICKTAQKNIFIISANSPGRLWSNLKKSAKLHMLELKFHFFDIIEESGRHIVEIVHTIVYLALDLVLDNCSEK